MLSTASDFEDTPTSSVTAGLAVLIPVWQPDTNFTSLVASLLSRGFSAIVIVDDGGGPEYRAIFDEVLRPPEVHVLRHAINLGKGRALKTGMNYFLNVFPSFEGLITADADGQHTPADILTVAETFRHSPRRMVLGTREFSGNVPLRSRIGNNVTRQVFGFITGKKLADTQTGLRAIPTALIPELLTLDGERYEYEMTMLAHVCRSGTPPVEVAIRTVYLDGNRSSHFDPLRDSMRIYFVLFRFYLSSLFTAGLDMVAFTAMFWVTGNVLWSVIFGRTSSLVNFTLNKRFVFNSGSSVATALWRYYLLVVVLGGLSYLSIRALTINLSWNVFAAKIVVESLLSLASFSIQRTFVFAPSREEEQEA